MKITLVLFMLIPATANANELADVVPSGSNPRIVRTVDFVNKLMATTMLCENAIGREQYQAARQIGLSRFTEYAGKEKALEYIKGIEQRFSADPRMMTMQKTADRLKCTERINDIYFEYSDL
ncbi:hypothetical protein [Mesorhizobium sp. B4-1-4]|uniref:hypothetical protein n=1 Tax=Mesorhizobium sp. B4-1-4 TaxID=2589888 RepID=UPI0011298A6D|nr:hypothetical protein [Mesorhizobium sp. B4-1-4]UCI30513.1 hypothetical protein FJW03_22280 [Mesorhizobium sp. B4-1-4]